MNKNSFGKLMVAAFATLALNHSAFALGEESFTVTNSYFVSPSDPGVHLSASGNLGPKALNDDFDLTSVGFVAGTDKAYSGIALFDITDFSNPNDTDRLGIDLGNLDVLPSGVVTNYAVTFDVLGGIDSLDLLAEINNTGELDYKITAVRGDFFLDDAFLNVHAFVPGSTGEVPDSGATAASLLALSLAGIALVGRKIRA